MAQADAVHSGYANKYDTSSDNIGNSLNNTYKNRPNFDNPSPLLQCDGGSLLGSWHPAYQSEDCNSQSDLFLQSIFTAADNSDKHSGKGEYTHQPVSYSSELERLNTFKWFPQQKSGFVEKLAAAGFYFMLEGDKTKCFCCGIQFDGWVEDANPMKRHADESPRCSFIKGRDKTNRPITDTTVVNTNGTVVKDKKIITKSKKPQGDMKNEQERQRTFPNSWKEREGMTKNECAKSGVYYRESDKALVCPYCGSVLSQQEYNTDSQSILDLHRRKSPGCPHLRESVDKDLVTKDKFRSGMSFDAVKKNSAARAVIDLGFGEKIVWRAMQMLLNKKDCPTVGEVSADTLLQKVFELKDEDEKFNQERAKLEAIPEMQQIVQEHKRLHDGSVCRLCEKDMADLLFLPCKHLVTCESCGEAVQECVQCGVHILATVKVFMV